MICQAQIHVHFDSHECVLQRLVHIITQSQQLLYQLQTAPIGGWCSNDVKTAKQELL